VLADQLLMRFTEFDRAVHACDVLERRLREHPGSPTTRSRSLAACEQVLRSRSELYRCLIRQGWQPPSSVLRELLDDELLVDEPLGPVGG
jgi:hypothetical protein